MKMEFELHECLWKVNKRSFIKTRIMFSVPSSFSVLTPWVWETLSQKVVSPCLPVSAVGMPVLQPTTDAGRRRSVTFLKSSLLSSTGKFAHQPTSPDWHAVTL